MSRPGVAAQEIAGEALWIGGLVGALWFASWLYEIGFMARFHVPAALVEIGLPRALGIVGIAGLLGTFAVALLMSASGGHVRRAFVPASMLATLAMLLAAAAELPGELAAILPLPLTFDTHLLKLALLGCLIAYTARFFARCIEWGESADFGRVVLAGALALALLVLPVWLGWIGGQAKADSPRTFLYLAEDRRFVLIRIYDDKAIFVRRDPSTGTFEPRYLVHSFADEVELHVTRTVP